MQPKLNSTIKHALLCCVKVKVSNYGKWCLKSKSSRKVWQFHFYFLLLSPTYASRPTRLGFWADSVWLRICLYLWKSVYFALFLTSLNLENFKCLSELSNDRCSCSSLYMILYTESGLSHMSAILCYRKIYKLNCVGSALPVQQTRVFQNLRTWTGKCQVPRISH